MVKDTLIRILRTITNRVRVSGGRVDPVPACMEMML